MKKLYIKSQTALELVKNKFAEALKNEKGITTLETILVIVIFVGIAVLVFKPAATALYNTILGIWSTDITTMFNNAQ